MTIADGATKSTTFHLDDEQKMRLLRRSFIFRGLDETLLGRLARLSRTHRLPAGNLLFQQGEEGDALYGIAEGLIRVWVSGDGGKELTLGLLEPGDVFGEIALLDGLPRSASVEAVEDSLLVMVRREAFLPLLDAESGLARHVIELLCERVRDSTKRASEFAFLTLPARLALKLQALAIAHGHDQPDGTVRVALKLSQGELAQMLGVTREAVNKQLKSWGQEGLVRHAHGQFIVVDRHRLAAIAEGNDSGIPVSLARVRTKADPRRPEPRARA
jgi:CRP-like cAMP-binding protein